MKKPLYISICSQKGGVGKSTFTCLLASNLTYHYQKKVIVLDCDAPQYSIDKFRKRELEVFGKNNYLAEKMEKEYIPNGIELFPVIPCTLESALDEAEKIAKESEIDIIFFDFPGTINSEEVTETLFEMDYLFIPMEADHMVIQSTLEFAIIFNVYNTERKLLNRVWLFWNKVDRREVNELYLNYERIIESIRLPVMQTNFPLSAKFRKEINSDTSHIFKSTLFASSRQAVKGTSINIEKFVREFLSIIQLDFHTE